MQRNNLRYPYRRNTFESIQGTRFSVAERARLRASRDNSGRTQAATGHHGAWTNEVARQTRIIGQPHKPVNINKGFRLYSTFPAGCIAEQPNADQPDHLCSRRLIRQYILHCCGQLFWIGWANQYSGPAMTNNVGNTADVLWSLSVTLPNVHTFPAMYFLPEKTAIHHFIFLQCTF